MTTLHQHGKALPSMSTESILVTASASHDNCSIAHGDPVQQSNHRDLPITAAEQAMLDKAITFVNAHVPAYGERPYGGDHQAFQESPAPKMEDVPAEVGAELAPSLVAAVRYIRRAFDYEFRQFALRRGGDLP